MSPDEERELRFKAKPLDSFLDAERQERADARFARKAAMVVFGIGLLVLTLVLVLR